MNRHPLLFLTLWGLLSLRLQAGEINWLIADFAPCHMPDDEQQKGYCDELDGYMMSRLPEYQHHISLSSFPRYEALMKTDANFCTSDLLFSEQRNEYMDYSRPMLPILPNGVLIRTGDERFDTYIDPQGKVDLYQLLQQHLILGINQARSYSPEIDKLLFKFQGIALTSIMDSRYKAIDLLVAKRFDYTFGYPTEVGLFEFQSAENIDKVRYIPIAGVPPLFETYFSCKKSPASQRHIGDINRILQHSDVLSVFVPFYQKWLPEAVVADYQQRVNDYLTGKQVATEKHSQQ
ncbi:hypothetical protein [Neptunicella sp. SCSIO 80796]|uniref:hypothetical protein n=1 Tax=Neptunicella plasticusilytica TaxID=3117012 RepID=UPI003A4E14BF